MLALVFSVIVPFMALANDTFSHSELLNAKLILAAFERVPARLDDIIEPTSDASGTDYRRFVVLADEQLRLSGFYLYPESNWIATQGTAYLERPELVLSAQLNDVRLLLGGLSRQERFHSGLIARAILAGVYKNAYQRVSTLSAY